MALTGHVHLPKIPLGEMRVVAYADRHNTVNESHENNNIRTWGEIPVLARIWNVNTLRAEIRTVDPANYRGRARFFRDANC